MALRLLVCLLLWSGAAGASERSLSLITSSSIPPYAIMEQQAGIVVDVMTEALALQGYTFTFSYSTNRRLLEELHARRVDGAFNFPAALMEGFYYSDAIIDYQNVAITLSRRDLAIASVADLVDKRVVAFQNASFFLGPEYAAMVEANPNHEEVNDQRSQLYMLFNDRADAIVMDLRIFQYFHGQLRHERGFDAPYHVHVIFPPQPRYAVFTRPEVRDAFNTGLRQLKADGRYDAIVSTYLDAPLK
ncbi:MAG: transporter substrate-binding domain-containing protein [Marinobacter sp.]|nr:transporter substrate-binding domain-containing protein [Marinobacter sp.]